MPGEHEDYGENCTQVFINEHAYSGDSLAMLKGDDAMIEGRMKILLGEIREQLEFKPAHFYRVRLTVIESAESEDPA